MLVSDAREAIKGDAPLDRLRNLAAELQQVYYGLSAAPSGDGGPTPGEPGGPPDGAPGDDDVIDAEFTPHE